MAQNANVALMPAKPRQFKSKHLKVMSHQCHTMSPMAQKNKRNKQLQSVGYRTV